MPKRGPVYPTQLTFEDNVSQEFAGEFSAHQGIYIPPGLQDTIIDTSPFEEGTQPHGIPMDWLQYQTRRRAYQTRPDDAALATAQYGNRCNSCGSNGDCQEKQRCSQSVQYGQTGMCGGDTACQFSNHELIKDRAYNVNPSFMTALSASNLPGFAEDGHDIMKHLSGNN